MASLQNSTKLTKIIQTASKHRELELKYTTFMPKLTRTGQDNKSCLPKIADFENPE